MGSALFHALISLVVLMAAQAIINLTVPWTAVFFPVVILPLLARDRYAGLPPLINIGVGEDLTIRELAELVKRTVGFEGEVVFDTTKPDGTPRKLLNVSRLVELGWGAKTNIDAGLGWVYCNFNRPLKNHAETSVSAKFAR